MGTLVVKRMPRRPAPEFPAGEVILDAPPEIPPPTGRAWGQLLMVVPMLAGAAAMALMFSSGNRGPLGYITGALFGVSAIGMLGMTLANGSGGPSKSEMAAARRQYMRHLAQHRRKVRRTIRQQREAMYYRHPDPDGLWATAASHRLWERRAGDGDFAVVRIGLGPQEIATPLVPPPSKPLEDLEPVCAQALRRFLTTYAVVPDLPVALALNGFGRVYVRGHHTRALVRAMIAQASVAHPPEDIRVAVCAGPTQRAAWEWVKWLPHATHPDRTDALGPLRLVGPTVRGLEAMLDDIVANRPRFNAAASAPSVGGPHLVVVLDGGELAGSDHLMTDGGVEGVTIVDLQSAPPRLLDRTVLVLDVDADGQLQSETMDGPAELGRADLLAPPVAEALARQLAPLRLSHAARGEQSMTTELGLAELLALGDPYTFDVDAGWTARPNRDRLRVPIGIGPEGTPVELDLKESAQDGMGPHGLLIGATGSGKSELLRTLVLALATTHPSETLNFVLVDFKGGATFTKLDRLPHTSAVITNLSDELPLVDRMKDAINGELLRRQELLRKAGNYSSLRDYEKARAAGAPIAPLPSLLIICDEFSELLSAKPDFIDMFVQIGRVGRSLGVHLLLASQRLEEGRLRGLDTHLSYRVGLRTFSAIDSRTVLGTPDAFELPRAPGHGYMRYGTEPLVRFRAAYVSGVHSKEDKPGSSRSGGGDEVLDFSTAYVAPEVEEEQDTQQQEEDDEAVGESLLDILVERLEGRGTAAHQVWLPPLSEPPTLDQLLPPLVLDPRRGTTVGTPELHGALKAVIGVIDKPLEQRRDLLTVDLAGGAGHAVVVGGTQSGKSTLLRTLITSLALTHTPREVQFYCLDFGGGALTSLRDLPHVGGVATRLEPSQVRRTVAELHTLLEERERLFAEHGIDGMGTYRRLKRGGRFADDPFGDVFLVLDGWQTVRAEFDDLEAGIGDLVNRGLSFGIHLAAAAARWMDLRPAVRDLLGTRVELRLGDPGDSMIDRRAAMNVPERTPGRGIAPGKLHMLTAVPRIDGRQTSDELAEAVAKLVQEVRNGWPSTGAPPVRLLPDLVPYQSLPVSDGAHPGLAVGIAEADLRPVHLDFATDPHFLLFGDSECGKSTFLRTVARRITETYTPAQAKIIAVDYRRSLLGAIESDHLIGYGTSAAVARDIITEAASVMAKRLPGPDVTPEQLRTRSWWKGPDLYVLVDDYDLAVSSTGSVLAPMLDYLAQARDVGLHVVLARRCGGVSRALYEPVLMRIRELGSPGVVMSGSRDEGIVLGNVKPSALPPGRGWLVNRKSGSQLVQLAHLPPTG